MYVYSHNFHFENLRIRKNAGVPGGFSRGAPVFAHLLIGPSHISYINVEKDVKLNLKKKCRSVLKCIENKYV